MAKLSPPAYPEQKPAATWQNARPPTRSKNQQLPGAKCTATYPEQKTLLTRRKNNQSNGTATYLAQNTPLTRSKTLYTANGTATYPAQNTSLTRSKITSYPAHHLPGVKSLPPNMALRCRNEQFYYSCSRKKVGTLLASSNK